MHLHRTSCKYKRSNIHYRVTLCDHPSTWNQSQWKPCGSRLSSSISLCDLLIIHLPAFYSPRPQSGTLQNIAYSLYSCRLLAVLPDHTAPDLSADIIWPTTLTAQRGSISATKIFLLHQRSASLSQSLWVKCDSVTTQAAESRACRGGGGSEHLTTVTAAPPELLLPSAWLSSEQTLNYSCSRDDTQQTWLKNGGIKWPDAENTKKTKKLPTPIKQVHVGDTRQENKVISDNLPFFHYDVL